MTSEIFGDNGDHRRDDTNAAELQPVSQETLQCLVEGVRSSCSGRLLATFGSCGVSFEHTPPNGKPPVKVDLYYYGDDDGPTKLDDDGSMRQDTGVQATISKIERAQDSQPGGKKLLTSYKIRNDGGLLDIEKRVRPFELPLVLKIGERLVVDEAGPPLITAEERQASKRQEDELGLSSVSEIEAGDLLELIRAS